MQEKDTRRSNEALIFGRSSLGPSKWKWSAKFVLLINFVNIAFPEVTPSPMSKKCKPSICEIACEAAFKNPM